MPLFGHLIWSLNILITAANLKRHIQIFFFKKDLHACFLSKICLKEWPKE